MGQSHSKGMNIADLRYAYHALKLASDLQKYYGIMPYYGSPKYFYLRLGMFLIMLPAIWQQIIEKVFERSQMEKETRS